jgi:hypothetical protein
MVYNARVKDWAMAVQALGDHIGSIEKIYLPLLTAVEEAKAVSANARYEML